MSVNRSALPVCGAHQFIKSIRLVWLVDYISDVELSDNEHLIIASTVFSFCLIQIINTTFWGKESRLSV